MPTIEDAIYEGKWLIALSAAGKFLGKVKPDSNAPDYPRGLRLEPVYEIAMVAQNVRGQQQVMRQLMPILLISSDIGVGFSPETATIDLGELPTALTWRIKAGWELERALTTPVRPKKSSRQSRAA